MARLVPLMMLKIGNKFRCWVMGVRPWVMGSKTERGFTLVELLISVAILGFGLLIIIQSFFSSLNGLNASRNYTDAMNLANDKISGLELIAYEKNGLLPELGLDAGRIRIGNRDFSWSSQILEVAEPQYLAKELVEACIKVDWKERNILKSAALATYLPRFKE